MTDVDVNARLAAAAPVETLQRDDLIRECDRLRDELNSANSALAVFHKVERQWREVFEERLREANRLRRELEEARAEIARLRVIRERARAWWLDEDGDEFSEKALRDALERDDIATPADGGQKISVCPYCGETYQGGIVHDCKPAIPSRAASGGEHTAECLDAQAHGFGPRGGLMAPCPGCEAAAGGEVKDAKGPPDRVTLYTNVLGEGPWTRTELLDDPGKWDEEDLSDEFTPVDYVRNNILDVKSALNECARQHGEQRLRAEAAEREIPPLREAVEVYIASARSYAKDRDDLLAALRALVELIELTTEELTWHRDFVRARALIAKLDARKDPT